MSLNVSGVVWLNDAFYLLVISIVMICMNVYNFKESREFLCGIKISRNVKLSDKTKRILLIKDKGSVQLFGLLYHILNTYLVAVLSILLLCFIFVELLKILFSLNFLWLSVGFLYFSVFFLLVYSTLMVIIFGFLSWIFKKKRGL